MVGSPYFVSIFSLLCLCAIPCVRSGRAVPRRRKETNTQDQFVMPTKLQTSTTNTSVPLRPLPTNPSNRILVYLLSLTGLESLQLSFLDSMIFGSVLSATDPVTILAIFNQLKVDPKLYSVIFGESILNDAVSIVMFE